MKHSVVIDDNRLEEARQVLGTQGIRETVEPGLREGIRRHRTQELRRSLGKVELNLNSEELSRLRSEESWELTAIGH